MGDVAMLAARLVGSSGEVVGVERDAHSITRARARVVEAELNNVRFTQCDVNQFAGDRLFDAVVGRFILEFVPDPVAVLRSLFRLIRPGGVVAFHEVSHTPFLALSAHLPLWSATVSLARETLRRSGANTEIGPALHPIFQEAGIPAPSMRLEMLLGNHPDFTRWSYDVLCSLRPHIERYNLSLKAVGDFDTLAERLQAEVAASNTVVPWVALVGAWARKPADEALA
jgi:SAM-dependent methyltransferase